MNDFGNELHVSGALLDTNDIGMLRQPRYQIRGDRDTCILRDRIDQYRHRRGIGNGNVMPFERRGGKQRLEVMRRFDKDGVIPELSSPARSSDGFPRAIY